jgi:DNA-binding transcriptional ArsR family regulator
MSENEEISQILKALANPTRIALLKELLICKNCINGYLVNKFPYSQSTISQHLEVLVKAKLISVKRTGKTSHYCINGETFSDQLKKLTAFADLLTLENIQKTAA